MCQDHGHVHVPLIELVSADSPGEGGMGEVAAGRGAEGVRQQYRLRSPHSEWAGETLQLEPVDAVHITTVCDNSMDLLLMDEGPAHRLSLLGEPVQVLPAPSLLEGKVADLPIAQHGFSVLVTVTKGEKRHRFLFDTGVTPEGCVENMARLDLDPGDVEVIVCSHGHFDHATGLSGLADRVGRTNMPVLIHPEFWARRRINVPGMEPKELPTTSKRALEDAGFDIVETRRPSFLFERSVLVTGEVDRTTDFETGFPIHEALRGDTWEPDPLILDDQALILNVRGKGLVVVTGCGHAGVVNILRYAQRLTGVEEIAMLMGGFHLSGPLFEHIIEPTCAALDEIGPASLVPAHCTGWKAQRAMSQLLPDAYIQNSVGTSYSL